MDAIPFLINGRFGRGCTECVALAAQVASQVNIGVYLSRSLDDTSAHPASNTIRSEVEFARARTTTFNKFPQGLESGSVGGSNPLAPTIHPGRGWPFSGSSRNSSREYRYKIIQSRWHSSFGFQSSAAQEKLASYRESPLPTSRGRHSA